MTKFAVFAIAILLIAGFVLLPHIWNPVENGPDVKDPSEFIGCYEAGSNKLILSLRSATVVKTHQRTRVDRFLYLKTDAAISTVNNLQYDASGNDLRIGSATTGFFYRFDRPSKPSALLIPDDGGNVRRLSRVTC